MQDLGKEKPEDVRDGEMAEAPRDGKTPPPILWRCPSERLAGAPLTAYSRWLADGAGVAFDSYEGLWRWSTTELEAFWESIWRYFEVQAHTPYDRVLERAEMPGARWFAGATLNFVEHCFRNRDSDAVAILHESELRDMQEWTWGELRSRVASIAGGLRALGIKPGDRVAGYMPNLPEAVAAFMACASLGAVWSSCSPDFGAPAVIDRFRQIEPRVLLAVDGYRYGGRDFDRMDTVAELRKALPTVEHTVLLGYLDPSRSHGSTDEIGWVQFEGNGAGQPLQFTALPFDHPLWILYSSGTTGLPKPIVHGHGGILLEMLKMAHLQFDLRGGDRFFWFTTTGWVMWNVLVSALLTPAAIVLYDGNPGYPDNDRLWSLAERAQITCFGASAAFLTACMRVGVKPAGGGRLERLRSIGSTGSPLPAEVFRWVYSEFPEDVWLFSVSGGTDVAGAFVGGAVTVPVYEGEISARMLGAAVESWDEAGHSLIGRTGELVITAPMPSMPLRLWGDDSGERLRDSYFSVYPGVWRHGDWITITDRGTSIIRGRSDATINRGGVRMGTSELYRAVLLLPDVLDAVAVDLPLRDSHGSLQMFVVLTDGTELDGTIRNEIRSKIRNHCSPRHVPDEIVQVTQIPRTLTGKVVEVPLKRILMGEPPDEVLSRDSLADPEAVDWFASYGKALRADRGSCGGESLRAADGVETVMENRRTSCPS
jgi:acetoacetyl-CoA synthetase